MADSYARHCFSSSAPFLRSRTLVGTEFIAIGFLADFSSSLPRIEWVLCQYKNSIFIHLQNKYGIIIIPHPIFRFTFIINVKRFYGYRGFQGRWFTKPFRIFDKLLWEFVSRALEFCTYRIGLVGFVYPLTFRFHVHPRPIYARSA